MQKKYQAKSINYFYSFMLDITFPPIQQQNSKNIKKLEKTHIHHSVSTAFHSEILLKSILNRSLVLSRFVNSIFSDFALWQQKYHISTNNNLVGYIRNITFINFSKNLFQDPLL